MSEIEVCGTCAFSGRFCALQQEWTDIPIPWRQTNDRALVPFLLEFPSVVAGFVLTFKKRSVLWYCCCHVCIDEAA